VFTGIVESVGRLIERRPQEGGRRLVFSHPGWTEGVEIGASVAVDGCCLSVVASDASSFTVEATRETLARTRFGALGEGEPVNLERALRLGDRLGGHWVQGHVDGLLEVTAVRLAGETRYVAASVPSEARDLVVAQGSVALNGVSLTVLDVDEMDLMRVAVIPHTWTRTNLSTLEAGALVHVEYDLLAKYVRAALVRGHRPS
jgi:riboflavin synthase